MRTQARILATAAAVLSTCSFAANAADTVQVMEKVADWQLAHLDRFDELLAAHERR